MTRKKVFEFTIGNVFAWADLILKILKMSETGVPRKDSRVSIVLDKLKIMRY